MSSKNSWILSAKNKVNTKYNHFYFCKCGKEFKLHTKLNESEAPNVVCPSCGNDYFKNVKDFISVNGRIEKYIELDVQENELSDSWKISLIYHIPIYYASSEEAILEKKEFLYIELKKDGRSLPRIVYKSTFNPKSEISPVNNIGYKSKFISEYNIPSVKAIVPFLDNLDYDIKVILFNYVMKHKVEAIKWIDENNIKKFSTDDKFKYVTFFLKNSHLKEHKFFFWKMESLLEVTRENPTEDKMLNYVINQHKEKSVKRALYKAYDTSLNHIGHYYPYSDYIFSRTIKNIDLLIKLLEIDPKIKRHLFSDEIFSVGIKFILFLKKHYTEIQIVNFFIAMQNQQEHKNRLLNWQNTLHMFQRIDAFNVLNEHFSKVKLTAKNLHDAIEKILPVVFHILDNKEIFEYDKVYLSACCTYEELEFKLPSTVKELSLWEKEKTFVYTYDKQF